MHRLAQVGLVGVVLVLLPAKAAACATCGCGDPTLTVMGTGVPFAGRVRVWSQIRYHWDRIERVRMQSGRMQVGVAWAPTSWLWLSGSVPLVVRDARWPDGNHATVVGPGEAQLRARAVLLKDRAFAPSHLLGLEAGLWLPTSITQRGQWGRPLPVDGQTGSGLLAPTLGLFYTHLADPWAVFVSWNVYLPSLTRRYDEVPGPSMRTTAALQYRLESFTLRAGANLRWDLYTRSANGTDPGAQTFTVFLAPDVLWAPTSDVILRLGLRVPVAQVTAGNDRKEGLYVLSSVIVDI